MDLITNPKLSDFILGTLCDFYIERFKEYIKEVGPYIQIINVNDDLGTQDALQISPEIYRKRIKLLLQSFLRPRQYHFLLIPRDLQLFSLILFWNTHYAFLRPRLYPKAKPMASKLGKV